MDERDIWRAAKLLIDQHGDDAGTHAAMRADGYDETSAVLLSRAIPIHRTHND